MKATLNFIIDVIAFTGFLFLTTTGVLMRYLLPPGSGRFASLWGLNRHEWGTIHFWISVAFLERACRSPAAALALDCSYANTRPSRAKTQGLEPVSASLACWR